MGSKFIKSGYMSVETLDFVETTLLLPEESSKLADLLPHPMFKAGPGKMPDINQ
jgi:hypothetical protein